MNISVTQNVQKFLECINKNGPLVGFDLGTKTIGVAISDVSRTIASPVVVIKRKMVVKHLYLLTMQIMMHQYYQNLKQYFRK